MTIRMCQMRSEFCQIKIAVDNTQQMILGNKFLWIDDFEPFSLCNLMPHRDWPRFVSYRIVLPP
jgi:hypothetical protein